MTIQQTRLQPLLPATAFRRGCVVLTTFTPSPQPGGQPIRKVVSATVGMSGIDAFLTSRIGTNPARVPITFYNRYPARSQ